MRKFRIMLVMIVLLISIEDMYAQVLPVDSMSRFGELRFVQELDFRDSYEGIIDAVVIRIRKSREDSNRFYIERKMNRTEWNDSITFGVIYDKTEFRDSYNRLKFEYQVQYQFSEGKSWTSGWNTTEDAVIMLNVPYKRTLVEVDADSSLFQSGKITSCSIKLEYPFMGETKTTEWTLQPGDQKRFYIMSSERGFPFFNYTIRWRFKDGTEKVKTGRTDQNYYYVTVPDK